MRKILLLGLIAITVIACEQKKAPVTEEVKATPMPKLLPQLQSAIDSHGGLDAWRSFRTLSFDRISREDKIKHIIDLNSRNEVFVKDSSYTVGYLGDKSWVLPDSSAFTNVRFYKNLYFYFFALPFVAADEGAIHESLGQKTFNGQLYDLIKISYGENIGDAPDDQYILYVNSETKRLDMINYSVTYFDNTKGESYNALVYNEWEEVSGILLPKSFDGYQWKNDTLGDLRYPVRFENISLSKERPNPKTFEIPKDAYVK